MAIYKGRAFCQSTAALGARWFAVGLTADTRPDTYEDDPAGMDVNPTTSLILEFTQMTTGGTPPSAPDTVEVTLFEADTNTILAFASFSPGSGNWQVTLHPTVTGTSGGAPVIGDYRLHLRVIRTSIGTYDVNSDALSRSGIIRISPSSMTVQAWHNGATDPASWGDDIEVNIDLSHSYNLNRSHRQFDVEVRDSQTDLLYATQRTSGTDPKNAFVRVDDRFPAAEVGAFIDAIAVAVPSVIAPTSEPTATWITIPDGTTDRVDGKRVRKGPIPVDASVIVDHHLQINDNVHGAGKDVPTKARLTSDLGFVGFRLVNARSEGLNGITATETLADSDGLVQQAINRSVTTDTVNGEPGWSPSLAAWDSALPGGRWIHEVAITSSSADASEVGPVEGYTLLAIDPNLEVIVAGGHPSAANQSEHWHPGDDLLVGAAVYDSTHRHLEETDLDPIPTVVIGRFNTTYGVAQYLDENYTWQVLSGAATAHEHPLAQSPGDPRVWLTQLPGAITATFDHASLFFVASLHVNGTPYSGTSELPAPGAASSHGRSYEVMTSGGPVTKDEHWSPGGPFQAGLAVIDMESGIPVQVDGFKQVALVRLQDTGAGQGFGEYLALDGTWKPTIDGATPSAMDFHDLTETRPGSGVYIKTWMDTSDWGSYDIFTLGKAKVGFFEFNNYAKEIGVGGANKHGGHSLDPIGLALNGVLGTR